MKLRVQHNDPLQQGCELLVIAIAQGQKRKDRLREKLDQILHKTLHQGIAHGQISAELGSVFLIPTLGISPVKQVLVVGLGKEEEITLDSIRKAMAAVVKKARALKVDTVTIAWLADDLKYSISAIACAQAEGALLGLYAFLRWKDQGNNAYKGIKEIIFLAPDIQKGKLILLGIAKGRIFADAVVYARDLINQPANHLTPSLLAKAARKIAHKTQLSCRVIEEKALVRMGAGQIIAVGQGSTHAPCMIILEYKGAPQKKEKIAIVGKGVTFDSGGISLKPSEGMEEMKTDMAGAGAVLGIMQAISLLKPKINLLGIIPAAENMPSGSASRPGDVVCGLNGKTVEIISTDAEGRMLLADAIVYAERMGCGTIIDIATLTGACRVALGPSVSGIFGRDGTLVDALIQAGQSMGESLWRLPLYDEYREMLKSDVADIKNCGSRGGGAITGALYLEFFVRKAKWVHIDIAGPAYTNKESGYITKGATGVCVRTLLQWLTR